MEDWKRGAKIISIILLTALLLFLVFYNKQCKDESCFNSYLEKCTKADYTKDTVDSIWQYQILGKQAGKCAVNVKMLVAKEGNVDIKNLEGKEMVCYTELGLIKDPRADLKNCHGILKEEMQELIIQKMHNYIVTNVGKISEELQKII